MKRYIKASGNGVFTPSFILKNSSIDSKEEAQKLSDYIWNNELDSGFRTKEDFLDVYDFDDLYNEMQKRGK